MQTDQIGQLLEQFGQALSEGDLHHAANCWGVPALVLSDDGATAVSASSEIEEFFSQAAEWYHLQGIASTKPEIERVDMLSEKLAAVDVRWPSFDASGREVKRTVALHRAVRRRRPGLHPGRAGKDKVTFAGALQPGKPGRVTARKAPK
jgi:hypothetical protein